GSSPVSMSGSSSCSSGLLTTVACASSLSPADGSSRRMIFSMARAALARSWTSGAVAASGVAASVISISPVWEGTLSKDLVARAHGGGRRRVHSLHPLAWLARGCAAPSRKVAGHSLRQQLQQHRQQRHTHELQKQPSKEHCIIDGIDSIE